jgi:monofunctional glycosyltransferase
VRKRLPRGWPKRGGRGRLRRLAGRVARWLVVVVGSYLLVCLACLVALRWVDPPTTALQVQRRVEALIAGRPYRKQCAPVPLGQISNHLEHAVIAAEDSRFFTHNGVDWGAVQDAVEDNRRRRAWRGGSTITQQLVKNLFLTSRGSFARKALEVPLAYAADTIVPKSRLLEVYLNVVEWGDGVFGAEAAARKYYGRGASSLDRGESARLAACLPSPRRRSPDRMHRYGDVILDRMDLMGW